MKIYKIEDRKGWVALPEKYASFSFPLHFGSIQGATAFPFKSAAQKMIKKYHLEKTAHVEEFEYESIDDSDN